MHAVKPEIVITTENQDIDLFRVNKFTIANNAGTDLQFGFTDNMVTLTNGQATAFESGANAWFSEGTKLKIRFRASTANSAQMCTVMLCRVEKPSNIFADALK